MRPKVITKCDEDNYSASNERAVRVVDRDNKAAFYLNLRSTSNGLEVEVYRVQGNVTVTVPAEARAE